jgi:Flp pilus assembly protein TadD
MRIGYAATQRGDYQTALINFRRALQARPNDSYATQAIRNVETYIQRNQ